MDHSIGEMPWTCDFGELDRHKLPWVGGKGANLGEMTAHGFPVPPGFCVTTRAYRAFVEGGGEAVESLFRRLDALDATKLPDVRTLGKELRETLQALPIPSALEGALLHAWRRHGEGHSYAVRSSATAEDLPDASFAGQQDTYLNVQGAEALLRRVRDCWASLFTDRAIVYRVQNEFDHREVALSVVIQKMVLPEVSGIMFTADPLHQNRNIISIDAGFGLGEALVSGKVSADLYKIRKESLAIEEIEVADKKLAIWPVEGGGTIEEPLPDDKRHAQVLEAEQIKALAALGARIEAHYGSPQDIEWCIADGTLYVVQSRPITSLYPRVKPLPPDGTLHVYLSFNHAQVMLDPLKPLGASVISLLMPFGKEGQVTAFNRFLYRAGGRLYLDLTEFLRHSMPHKFVPKMLTLASEQMAAAIGEVIQRPRFRREMRTAFRFSLGSTARRIIIPIVRRAMANLWFRKPEGRLPALTAYIDQKTEEARAKIEAAAPGIERIDAMMEVIGTIFLDHILKVFLPVILPGFIAGKVLGALTGRKLNDPAIGEIMRGLEGNVTTEMDLCVADLAAVARRHPAVVAALREDPTEAVLPRLKTIEGGDDFLQALQGFLDRYGMRGPSEIDLTRDRWVESPTPLLQMLAGNLTSESSNHREHHAALAKAGEAAGEKIIAEIEQQHMGWLKAKVARRLVRVMRGLAGGREHPKFMMIKMLWLAKETLKEEAARQVEAGRLDAVEDIYYLELEEVRRMAQGEPRGLNNATWREQVAAKKIEHKGHLKLSPPGVVTSEGEVVVAKIKRDDLPPGALAGSPASAGIIEGVARVILDPHDAVLHHGEILVAPFTDPGWTPLFIHASALVMEVGGLMTHGSVVAREYGIPAVVGIYDVTQHIQNGQRIRVNGDSGYVEILDEDHSPDANAPETTASEAPESPAAPAAPAAAPAASAEPSASAVPVEPTSQTEPGEPATPKEERS